MGIKKLQRKFILIAAAAVIAVMSVVLLSLNFYNFNSTYRLMYGTLKRIAENGGEITFRKGPEQEPVKKDNLIFEEFIRGRSNGWEFNEESEFSLRYFSAVVNPDRTVEKVNIRHIAAVDEKQAEEFAIRAVFFGGKQGRFENEGLYYAYVVSDYGNTGKKIAVFMDCTREEESTRLVIRYSMTVGFFCLLIFIIIVWVFSGKAMQPVIRNIENQKAFITNAGHELKTPLAIISANTEVLEMTEGENEWTKSIRNQIDRLTILINNLITLSKTTETEDIVLENVDFSECAKTACSSYRTVIEGQGKALKVMVDDKVTVLGTRDGLSELINILLDNAAKYCDDGGIVTVELKNRIRGKGARLTVSNNYEAGENVDYSRFFERFYRGDKSHNSKKAGYGIGLSMAKGFAEQFNGRINAAYKDGVISFIVTF